jgi:hypothetical protein
MMIDSPDLGIAHQPITETYGDAVSSQRPIRMIFRDLIHVFGVARVDSIAFLDIG